MIPGSAPSTPARHESLALTKRPCSRSKESSPRYQTLPCLSWGVVVERPLDRAPPLGDRVADDRARDAEDPHGPVSDDLVVGLRCRASRALVVEGGARLERPVPVVDGRDEVRGIDRRVVASVNRRQAGRRGRCGRRRRRGARLEGARAAAARDTDEHYTGDRECCSSHAGVMSNGRA
jgi:hypothetical protein